MSELQQQIDLSTCMKALLCEEVHVPELNLPLLDENSRYNEGEVSKFSIYPEECCYGDHCGLHCNKKNILE